MSQAQVISAIAAAIPLTGLAVAGLILRSQGRAGRPVRRFNPFEEIRSAAIRPRLEYHMGNGALFYVVENAGNTAARHVDIALPACQQSHVHRLSPQARQLALALLQVGHKRYLHIMPGQRIEIPITQMAADPESAKAVFGLGLEVRMTWTDNRRGRVKDQFILPIEERRLRSSYREPVWRSYIANAA